jgi:ribosomal-protein-alanine N-acetyltransferase
LRDAAGPNMKIVLETERLLLRQFTEDDAESLFELDGDPEVMRPVGGAQYLLPDPDAYWERIRTAYFDYYRKYDWFGFSVAQEKRSAAFLGWFQLRPAPDFRFATEAQYRLGEFDLGYRLRRAGWCKGYATEGSRGLIAKEFGEPGVESVVAMALLCNRASIRVIEKVGMKFVCQFAVPGFDQPGVKYALTKEKFRAPTRSAG